MKNLRVIKIFILMIFIVLSVVCHSKEALYSQIDDTKLIEDEQSTYP